MDQTDTMITTAVEDLEARGVAFAVVARLLGPDPASLLDREILERLRDVVAVLDPGAADALPAGPPDVEADDLCRRWIRWFEHARIAPYEGSNVVVGAGGVTPRLADVAGFYRAFGFRVRGERPDHVVAELEFLSMVICREAAARRAERTTDATTCHLAARAFVRDHLGTWIDGWAARVATEPALSPWAHIAAVAARLTAAEAHRRNLVPVRDAAVLTVDGGVPGPDGTDVPVCGADV